jgi:hypothetical protein
MAKVWKKLQRSDADYTGNVTGTVDGETAGNIKTKAIAGAAAKVITDDAFDGSNKLKVANANDALKNANTTKSDVGLGNVDNSSAATIQAGTTKANVGLGNVTNESKATMFTSPAITGTPTGVTATHVGLSNVTNHAQIKTDGSNAPNALKNSVISISSAGVLSNAGGGTVSATGLGAVKTDLTNAPTTIVNSNTTATDVGLGSVANVRQNTTFYQDAIPTSLAVGDIWVDTNDSNKQYRADSVGADAVTSGEWEAMHTGKIHSYSKSDVGLSNVDNDSTSTIRSGTTAANVGLGNVTNASQATIQSATLSAATASDVGLSNVDNQSAATIQAGTTAGNVGLGNVTNESKSTMFAGPTFTGTVAGVSKSHVGLGSVDNTSDAAKPVSTAQATSIATKAPTASPTFTGTVAGVTKGHVGLGSVDNDSTSTIRAGTTKANVGLSSVIDQAITVASGKLKLDNVAQTMDADTIDGDSKATVKAAAVSTAETNIIGAAPGALNTLNELAAALGDDASFSSTMTTNLATKGKAPMTLTAEDTDGDSTYTNDPASEVVGQIGTYGGNQYVVVDI